MKLLQSLGLCGGAPYQKRDGRGNTARPAGGCVRRRGRAFIETKHTGIHTWIAPVPSLPGRKPDWRRAVIVPAMPSSERLRRNETYIS